MTFAELRIDIVILACAVSAGIHGALVEDHFREGTGAGIGFVVATVLLAAVALTLTRTPSQFEFVAAAAILIGLIASYGLAITTGVPVLHPDVEARRRSRTLHQGGRGNRRCRSGEPRTTPVIHPSHNRKEH